MKIFSLREDSSGKAVATELKGTDPKIPNQITHHLNIKNIMNLTNPKLSSYHDRSLKNLIIRDIQTKERWAIKLK